MGLHLRVPHPHIPAGEVPDTGMVKVEATTIGLLIIQLNSINVSRRKREVAATTTEAEIAVAVEAEVETEDPKIKIDTVEWKCSPYDNFWSPNFGPQFLVTSYTYYFNFFPLLSRLFLKLFSFWFFMWYRILIYIDDEKNFCVLPKYLMHLLCATTYFRNSNLLNTTQQFIQKKCEPP